MVAKGTVSDYQSMYGELVAGEKPARFPSKRFFSIYSEDCPIEIIGGNNYSVVSLNKA